MKNKPEESCRQMIDPIPWPFRSAGRLTARTGEPSSEKTWMLEVMVIQESRSGNTENVSACTPVGLSVPSEARYSKVLSRTILDEKQVVFDVTKSLDREVPATPPRAEGVHPGLLERGGVDQKYAGLEVTARIGPDGRVRIQGDPIPVWNIGKRTVGTIPRSPPFCRY